MIRTGTPPPHRDRSNHHDRFGAFPGDLFPTLPRGRKTVCMLHGLEKMATWVLCTLYDYLDAHNHTRLGIGGRSQRQCPVTICSAKEVLLNWVNGCRPDDTAQMWTRKTRHTTKGGDHWETDSFVGGRTAKMMFLVGNDKNDWECQNRWAALISALPTVNGELEVCEDGSAPFCSAAFTVLVGHSGVSGQPGMILGTTGYLAKPGMILREAGWSVPWVATMCCNRWRKMVQTAIRF